MHGGAEDFQALHVATGAVGEFEAQRPRMFGPLDTAEHRDLARAYLRASGRHRLVLPVQLPGAVFRGYRRGDHLAPERAVGRVTFEECLAERIPQSRFGAAPTSRRQ